MPQLQVARVDCTKNQGTCQDHGVQSYPTLKWIWRNIAVPYNGGRSFEDLKKWWYQWGYRETWTHGLKDTDAEAKEKKKGGVDVDADDIDDDL